MIKELRIGNYIDVNGTAVIRGTNEKGVWIRNKAFCIMDFKGIPLTEEWLHKLGVASITEPISLTRWAIRNLVIMVAPFGGFYIAYPSYPNNGIEIKYVHQLQNLVFALTGKELTLQP